MYRHVASLLLLVLVGCDDGDERPPPEPAPSPAADEEAAPLLELVRDADRRVVSPALRDALVAPDVERRRAAAVGLARIRSDESTALLRRALRDTDPEVRATASLGLGGLDGEAGDDVAAALAQALASETSAPTRALILRDLARLRRDDTLPAIEAAVRSEDEAERASGCWAAGDRGLGGKDVPGSIRSRVAALLASEQPDAVRLACAFALARLPAGEPSPGEQVALTMAATDPDPEVRAYAYRALARQPEVPLETLVHGTRDEDWRVAFQACRALASRAAAVDGGANVYVAALGDAYPRATEGGALAAGGPLHVLLAALDVPGPLARTGPLYETSVRLHRQLGELPPDTPATRDRGLAHCAAAELVARSRGWPSRVESCGLEQVLPRERRARAAAILGTLDGAEEQRVVFLNRLYRTEHPLVREAVLAAAARIWHPSATELVLQGLREDDAGVLAAATEALATVAGRAPAEDRVPPPLPVDRAVAGLRAASEALPEGELEGLVSWLGAVEAVDARALLPRVRELASHPSYAVRHRARSLLSAWQEALPRDAAEPPNVVELEQLLPPEARPRVRLETDRGAIGLELRPDAAPVTSARFLGLVRDGFYDGLTFHRVVSGFVAQGGDPRGDGYGGPGFWQRCEDNRLPYVRGTVGMALAGRDTGGSQFFLTQSAQPHLEGRYTAFAMVVEGLERVDLLQPGDHIRSARIVESP